MASLQDLVLIRKEVTYHVRKEFFLIRLIWQPDPNKKEM